jgi:hypothetical protein
LDNRAFSVIDSEAMSRFRFRSSDGRDIAPEEWLRIWVDRYPSSDYNNAEYRELIAKYKSLSGTDFERIGKWKDRAQTEDRWKPNVASVAYRIWMQAASELPECPEESRVADFLEDWSNRKYTDEYRNGVVREKSFGLSHATTLLHFISGGRFPIFDSRVREAMKRLLNSRVRKDVRWYLDSYCPLLSEIAALCGTKDLRLVDKALFSYGRSTLPSSN